MPVLKYKPETESLYLDDKFIVSTRVFCSLPEYRELMFTKPLFYNGERWVRCHLCNEEVVIEDAPDHLEEHLEEGEIML